MIEFTSTDGKRRWTNGLLIITAQSIGCRVELAADPKVYFITKEPFDELMEQVIR